MKKFIFIILVFLSVAMTYILNYVPNSVAGIRTADMTLVVNQYNQQTRKLHTLIERILNKDSNKGFLRFVK